MRRLDLKSIIIGFLSAVILFSNLHGTSDIDRNFGDVTVSSLTVENNGKEAINIGPGKGLIIYNEEGKWVSKLGVVDGKGTLGVRGKGERNTTLFPGGVITSNKYGETVSYIGRHAGKESGGILLSNKNGDTYFKRDFER